MAGNTMLFACTKCHSRHPFEELSREEQLCKTCRRKYPLVTCSYCQLEFHLLKKTEGNPICAKCSHNLSTYGQPKNCKYCQIKAAFKQSCCSRCISSEKRYGPPVQCQRCKKQCAFNKSGESKAKVGGEVLCLQCTLEYKRNRHRLQKGLSKEKMTERYSGGHIDSTVVMPLKAENLPTASFKSRFDALEKSSRQNSRSNSPFRQESVSENAVDSTFGDPMSEMTKLRDQIAMLKKVISQKEKVILEKDKKINEFQAEQWEKEKLLRQKIQAIQKESNERVEQLQLENQALRKQVSGLSKTRRTSKPIFTLKKIHLEAHKIPSPMTTSDKREAPISYDSTEEGGSVTTESDRAEITDREKKDAALTKVDHVTEDEIEEKDKDVDRDNNTATEGDNSEESDEGLSSAKSNTDKQISFDEAQEAEIKKLLKNDDGHTSSGVEENEVNLRRSKKRQKKKSQLTIEDDGDVSTGVEDDHESNIGPKKKRKKKRHLRIDEYDGEEEQNVYSCTELQEENNNRDKKRQTGEEGDEEDTDLTITKKPNEQAEELEDEPIREGNKELHHNPSDAEMAEQASSPSDSDELHVDED
ncbi:protein FAM76B-like isoform X2 [Hydractinia symbiolongicarpus]|uniref:protein FAM76B-like isoform X2 n=1 Tax=Hydractinia symbiolongicarpus TaxID=13093 RepID=UPI002550C1D6|nr:protein FAM76B-like isoform X2 [Hydractinia symbiolongicarpus]XP_057306937.1 protein FAM76B-like isoform X2 [Hydractinia symbiolongicarpus]